MILQRGPLRVLAGALIAALLGQGPMAAPPRSASVLLDSIISARPRPLIVGVTVHFGVGGEYGYEPGAAARALAEIGFDSFRDDLGWQQFDEAGGTIPPKLAGFMAATEARPLLILDAANPAVLGGNPPITPGGRAAYATFAARAAKVLAAKGAMVELGNEWNLTAARGKPWMKDAGLPDDPRAASNYAPLAAGAAAAIRAAAPDAKVVVGATGIDPHWLWAASVVKRLGAASTGLFSAHIYNQCEALPADRTAAQAVGQAEALHRAVAGAGGMRPPRIYLTETGWPTATKCLVSREQQADNLAQFLLWASAQDWIGGVWIYQLKDQGHNPADIEDNFGLLDYDYRPKLAACTVRSAIGLIKGAEAASVIRPLPDLFVLQQRTAGGRRLVVWTGRPGQTANLTLAGAKGTARTMCGEAVGNGPRFEVTGRPLVIDLAGDGPFRIAADAR